MSRPAKWPLEELVPQTAPVGDETCFRGGGERKVIPVMRPRLPAVRDLLPYLQSIDRAAWYSNYGPLVNYLEVQISRYLGYANGVVTTASSGTNALSATLLALKLPSNAECLMPSWTFAATPHAARAAGLIPFFHDVDPDTWALDPEQVRRTLQTQRRIAAIVAVSPFGAPINMKSWRTFEAETGVQVVIDAAAGFDTVRAGPTPTVVSLHATKIFGAGEGGFIVSTNPSLLKRIKICSNFGFDGTRIAKGPALNSKMSEYHAAVALANLDIWPETRRQHVAIAESYRKRVAMLEGVVLQSGYGAGWVSSTTNILLPSDAGHVAERLLRAGIETRRWWGEGCHVQPAFEDCPRTELPVTEDLGRRVLGLPHFADMTEADIDQVVSSLDAALADHK